MTPHIAGAAKSADNFVADQEDAKFAADGLNLRPVIGRRNDNAASTLNGFTDERSDIFGSDFEDLGLDRFGTGGAKCLGCSCRDLR